MLKLIRRSGCQLCDSEPVHQFLQREVKRASAELGTYPDEIVGEKAPSTFQFPLPPAPFILPDVTDDVTDSDGHLVIVLGLVIKLHNGFHCERKTERNKQSEILEVMVTYTKKDAE